MNYKKFTIAVFALSSIIFTAKLQAKTRAVNVHTKTTSVLIFCDGYHLNLNSTITAWFDKAKKRYLTEDPEFRTMHCSSGFKAKKINPRIGEWLSNIFYWKYDLVGYFSNNSETGKSCYRIGKNFTKNKAYRTEKSTQIHAENEPKKSLLNSYSSPLQSLVSQKQKDSETSLEIEGISTDKPVGKLTGPIAGFGAGTAIIGYGLYKLFEPIAECSKTHMPMDVNAERGRLDENGVPTNNLKINSMGVFSSDQPFPINSGVNLKTYQTNTEGFDQNNGKIAVIVEPRPLEILIKVIRHAMDALSEDWKFQVFHGSHNKLFMEKHFYHEIASGKLILTDMHCKNLSVKIYNNLMLVPEFWNHVLGETVLMFEIDSTVCGSDSSIEPFLEYDYVGAPWRNARWFNLLVYEKSGKKSLFIEPFLQVLLKS